MILILTKSEIETTTDHVIDWLKYYGASYIRLNIDELTTNINIKNSDIFIKNINISEFKVCWLRRFSDREINDIVHEIPSLNFSANSNIISNLYSEKKTLLDYLLYRLSNVPWITSPKELELNKLQFLYLAREAGLCVPNTLITEDKIKINDFLKINNNDLISKSISDFANVTYDSKSYNFLTTHITNKSLSLIDSEDLYISLFQSKIEKEYELRVFFLFDDIFTMAIFSQENEKTKLDYRNYDDKKPNRTSAYILPENIKNKVKKFIKLSNLTTGSIDLIKEKKTNNYYFLEVNPVGQFSNMSYICNYYLEKKIAHFLIKEDGEIKI